MPLGQIEFEMSRKIMGLGPQYPGSMNYLDLSLGLAVLVIALFTVTTPRAQAQNVCNRYKVLCDRALDKLNEYVPPEAQPTKILGFRGQLEKSVSDGDIIGARNMTDEILGEVSLGLKAKLKADEYQVVMEPFTKQQASLRAWATKVYEEQQKQAAIKAKEG